MHFNNAAESRAMFCIFFKYSYALWPVKASMRLMPLAIEDSETITKRDSSHLYGSVIDTLDRKIANPEIASLT